jgi:hypothetical protein
VQTGVMTESVDLEAEYKRNLCLPSWKQQRAIDQMLKIVKRLLLPQCRQRQKVTLSFCCVGFHTHKSFP